VLLVSGVTVILSTWKRNYLETQIQSVLNQSVTPDRIILYQNESHQDFSDLVQKYSIEHIHSRTTNFRYHSRFTIPLYVESEYFAIFDDDTIPAPRWLENCLRLSQDKNCIVGANGRIIVPNQYPLSVGDGASIPDDIQVDFVGHCWFVKRDHVFTMWKEKPLTYSTGEDIHLCASNKIVNGTRSFVPMQPRGTDLCGDTRFDFCDDDLASFKIIQNHTQDRVKLIENWLDAGWETVNASA
jgi:glycosyltransferase involved in cell wall biosynthesis